MSKTKGIVTKLEAEVVDPYSAKIVVGTMVTIQTTRMVEDKAKEINSQVYVEPNSVLPLIGDEVTITLLGDSPTS